MWKFVEKRKGFDSTFDVGILSSTIGFWVLFWWFLGFFGCLRDSLRKEIIFQVCTS